VVTYWVVLSIQTAFRNYARFQERAQAVLRSDLRASQLETQVAHARLGALKAQLQPHFLFNTLNAIVVLVRQQKGQQAERDAGAFQRSAACGARRYGRAGSHAGARARVSAPLSIHRTAALFRPAPVDIDVDPDLLDAAVPHMALQPLVENAIRHGVGQSTNPGVIGIRAARIGEALHVVIQDDGPGFACAAWRAGLKLGLSNTRARLQTAVRCGLRAAHRERQGWRRDW
jgi:LytS/YehU family sensor histidine kinase